MIPTIGIVGIVGGIGSGKSAVAAAMQSFGGHLITADKLGHEALLQPHIKDELRERWGYGILDLKTREVDRKKIAAIVFADAAELRFLEAQVFPYIEARIRDEIERARTLPDVKFIILDAAILLEAGWDKQCNRVVFVQAPDAVRYARLKENRGWSEDDVRMREAVQMPLAEKMNRADAVIVNDGEPEKIVPQVKDALERWRIIC
jgi:dephospho-CoA kinase